LGFVFGLTLAPFATAMEVSEGGFRNLLVKLGIRKETAKAVAISELGSRTESIIKSAAKSIGGGITGQIREAYVENGAAAVLQGLGVPNQIAQQVVEFIPEVGGHHINEGAYYSVTMGTDGKFIVTPTKVSLEKKDDGGYEYKITPDETKAEEEDESPGFWSKVGNFFANVADVVAQAIGAPAPKTTYDAVEIVEEAAPSIKENIDNIKEYRDSVDEDEDTLGLIDSSTDGLEEGSISKRFFDWVWGR